MSSSGLFISYLELSLANQGKPEKVIFEKFTA